MPLLGAIFTAEVPLPSASSSRRHGDSAQRRRPKRVGPPWGGPVELTPELAGASLV